MSDAEEGDRVQYQFDADRETWREWADNVPRSVALDDRLRTLIEQDLDALTDDGDGNDIEAATAQVFATRIRIRAATVYDALEGDDPDIETARSKAWDIIDLADTLEG